jgi:hypothetical protein
LSDEGPDPSPLWDCDDCVDSVSRVGYWGREGDEGGSGTGTVVCGPEIEADAKAR